MTANISALLPRALVLLDVPGRLRGSRAVVLRHVFAPVGDGHTVEVCVGPCPRPVHDVGSCPSVGLHPDELLLIPADAVEPTYRCCHHCDCPPDATAHAAPCTKCAQQPRETPDQRAARAMATEATS